MSITIKLEDLWLFVIVENQTIFWKLLWRRLEILPKFTCVSQVPIRAFQAAWDGGVFRCRTTLEHPI